MADLLDNRYVEYDLTGAINILPAEHGGTGVSTLGFADRILITEATGIPGSPLKIVSSLFTKTDLTAFIGYAASGNGPFEGRIQIAENHAANSLIHLPAGGDSSQYLRGDKTWQLISSLTADHVNMAIGAHPASAISVNNIPFDNFFGDDVQEVLEEIDQKIGTNGNFLFDEDLFGGT